MKIEHPAQKFLSAVAFLSFFAVPSATLGQTTTVHTVVTATGKSNEAPAVPQQSVTVLLDRKPQQISAWIPLRGSRSGLDMVLLLDDSSRTSLALHLDEMKTFLGGLPPGTRLAVGYMRNGSADLAQGFTTDRNAAINALRLPMSTPGGNGSPYFCLADLIKHWPAAGSNPRREVVMVTDGVDRYSGLRYDPGNPYVRAAIADAQNAGVIVYSIYFRGAGRADSSGFATDGGQNYLQQVSDATGGEAYLQGFGNPVSFAPFLSDIQRKLLNQYELSFLTQPKRGLQPMTVKTNQPNTKLQAQKRVLAAGAAAEK